MQTSRNFTTRIDISEQSRRQLIEVLNARLADAFDLFSQLKQAHWNVKGSDFIQLHELYDTIAADVRHALSNRRLMRRRWRASLYLILRSTSSRCRIPAFASLIASAALPVRGPSPAVALTMTLPTSAQARVVQQVAG